MKKIFSILLSVGISTTMLFAQSTNAEGSKYQFKKIVHLDATPVQSQGQTGTCWSFSATSFFESEIQRLSPKTPVILSEMYVVRKAYEMKADKYVRMDGKINFGEGGAFHDVPLVISNFGIVPYDVYTGLNGSDKYNHGQLVTELNAVMSDVLAGLSNPDGINSDWKRKFNSILDYGIGKDVVDFEWNGKKYTPKTYAASLGLDMNNYVSLTSFTNHPMNSQCMLEIPDNWAWGTSYNVSLDDLVETTISALKNGYTIAWGADVSEKGFSFKNGLAIVPADPAMIEVVGKDDKRFNDAGAERKSNAFLEPMKELAITPELRQKGYDNKTTTDDHGMHIVGLYQDQNGTRYFLVKNSWGTSNLPKGYLYVSENYFRYKTINIYLHKDGIPANVKNKVKW
ncbi:MAG: aminopeptidase C [Flavobacteriales bacterium]